MDDEVRNTINELKARVKTLEELVIVLYAEGWKSRSMEEIKQEIKKLETVDYPDVDPLIREARLAHRKALMKVLVAHVKKQESD